MTPVRRLKAQLLILAVLGIFSLAPLFSVGGWNASANRQVTAAVSGPLVISAEINGKTLTVLGENFVSGAKVLINGEPQKTQYDSPAKLIAKKAGRRLKAGDNLQVRNPDGETSPDFIYGEIVQAPYEIPVAANDLVYSPRTDRLYVSVNNLATQYSNTIAVINQRTTQVEGTIPVGRQPRHLAISDDYRFIYVIVGDGLGLQRVDLDANRMDLEIDLNASFGVGACPFRAFDVAVMPGHRESIAVSLYCDRYSAYPVVAIFDNGVRRQAIANGPFIGDTLCFGSTVDTLWGYDSADTSFALSQFHVDAQGVNLIGKPVEGLLFGFNQKIEFSNGLLYSTNGRAIHPEDRTFDGRFLARETLTANAFALDANAGRIYFGQREGYDFTLLEFDLRTYRLTRAYNAYYGLIDSLNQMVRCGSAGLALVVPPPNNRIVIFPLSLLKQVPSYQRPQPSPINGSVRRIALPNYQVTYDASRQLFYASVPSLISGYGNCVVKIDPLAGTVGDPVWVGSEPWQMAVSDNGQCLYTVLFGGRSVRRLRLPDLTFDLHFPLFNDGAFFQGPMSTTAADILTVPGHPESLIVARWGDHNHSQFDSDGVAVYDNGIKRPDSTPNLFNGAPSIILIQLSPSGAAVYGLGDTFTKMLLDANGVHIIASKVIGETAGIVNMRCQSGLCFTSNGLIIDPETQTMINRIRFESAKPAFYPGANFVLPDVPNNRIYYVVALGASALSDRGVHVLAYDLNTQLQVASFKVLGEEQSIQSFWLWGNDQFALSTGEEIVFFPKSLLQPVSPR